MGPYGLYAVGMLTLLFCACCPLHLGNRGLYAVGFCQLPLVFDDSFVGCCYSDSGLVSFLVSMLKLSSPDLLGIALIVGDVGNLDLVCVLRDPFVNCY